eukprot:4174275-Amphidinium_carterae.1
MTQQTLLRGRVPPAHSAEFQTPSKYGGDCRQLGKGNKEDPCLRRYEQKSPTATVAASFVR